METIFGLDYPTLWYLVVGALFSGYAILDGFDFGAGAWHLFFREEVHRRIALNAVGPVWDGNEVWLVIGGGALFAGFPIMYASFFSALYVPFMLFLLFLIFRAVSIEFRSKEPMKWWRDTWDITYSVSSAMLAVLLGVVLGNVMQGIAIGENFDYQGGVLFDFLNPYALLVGITTLALFMMHGSLYLLMKTEGQLYDQLSKLLKKAIIFFMVCYALLTLATLLFMPHLTDRMLDNVLLLVVPVLVLLSVLNIPRLVSKRKYLQAFLFSSLTISFLLMLVAMELFPVILSSTIDHQYDITIYNSASSTKSLGIMLTIVAIGFPLVLAYVYFVYRTFRGKVKIDETSY